MKKVLTRLDDRSIIAPGVENKEAFMVKEETRTRIIQEGATIVHEKGFNNTGVQEILRAAGVPKGSFYFYFKSKDDFGLAIIDFFSQYVVERMEAHFSDESLPHVKRLQSFFDERVESLGQTGYRRGCPIGNMAQELADLEATFREKLKEALDKMEAEIARCLRAAKNAGELDPGIDPEEAAHFILNSWEGALTRMKTEKNLKPLVTFAEAVFGRFLQGP